MQLLILLLFLLNLSLSHSSSIDSDIIALLAFKDSADPSNNSLPSWSSSTSPCTSSWLGVTCSSSTPSSSSSSLQLRVTRLVLEGLSLSGPIPPSLTSLSHLRVLSLKSNSLTGPIPPSISSLSSLRLLFLSHNNLSGPLPDSVSSLSHLYRLDLSSNSLTGPLSPLFNLTRLLTLRLDSNRFAGAISGLDALPSLQDLNLSSNSLSGAIPPSLSRFSSASFLPNSNLCGPPLSASCRNAVSDPSRPKPSSAVDTPVFSSPGAKPEARGQSGMAKTAVVAIVVGDFVILLVVSGFLFCYFWRKFAGRRMRRNVAGESEKIVYSSSPYHAAPVLTMAGGFERGKMVYFEGTRRFELEELLRASAEMLGKGGYGTTYKAVLDGGDEVAVKRLREVGAAGDPAPRVREFEAQMEVIGRMRHPNLVALKAYYYARDEKLLVYDYMTGGSLFALLHGEYVLITN